MIAIQLARDDDLLSSNVLSRGTLGLELIPKAIIHAIACIFFTNA